MLWTTVMLVVMAVGAAEARSSWSLWSTWYRCTETCEGGMEIRQRICKPVPTNAADICLGAAHEVRPCNTDKCPAHVEAGWSVWGSWYRCTESCERGMQIRERKCNNPVPTHPADNCIGPAHEVRPCNIEKCPAPGADFVGFCVKLTIGNWIKQTGVVPYDASLYNRGGYYHFGTQAFQAPTHGTYLFSLTAATYRIYDTELILAIETDGIKANKHTIFASPGAGTAHRPKANAATTVLLEMNKDALAYVTIKNGAVTGLSYTTFCGMLVQRLE